MNRFSLVPQYFGSLLFDRQQVAYLPFDHECTQLLREWATGSVDQSIANEENRQRVGQIVRFAEHLLERDVLTSRGCLDAEIVDLEPPASHLAGPLVVHLEIVGACNITCSHCFAGQLPRNQNPLTLDEIRGLFENLAAIGCYRVSLTGGEPLMRKDFFEIADAAIELGLHPIVTTNGLLIDETIAKQFAERPQLRINLSLEGSTAESNDAVRGEGVFDEVCQRALLLSQYTEYVLGFTITSQNAAEVDDCVQLARRLGASGAVFRPLYPVGIAQQHPELMPTYDQYIDALKMVAGVDDIQQDIRASDSQCGAGQLLASVSVQGDVNPCGFLGEGFKAANIRDQTFAEIWNHNQVFLNIRQSENETTFSGGCRARSLAFHGDARASDPWHDQHEADPDQYIYPLSNLYATRGES